MEPNIIKTKRKRILAWIYDFVFILIFNFTIAGIFGQFFKFDSKTYLDILIYPFMVVVGGYLFFGELIFGSTLGKYLTGIKIIDFKSGAKPKFYQYIIRGILEILWPIEALILIFNKQKRRLGDYLANTIVVNKENVKTKPIKRVVIGTIIILFFYFSYTTSMGLAIKKTDFYNVAETYLKSQENTDISGLSKSLTLHHDLVEFIVPTNNPDYKYAEINLERKNGNWNVYHVKFNHKLKDRSFNLSANETVVKEFYENDTLKFEGVILEDKKEGTCKWYHENGQLKEVTIWHNDLVTGKVLMYYPNGQIETEAYAENSSREGKATLYYENGQTKEVLFYKNNEVNGDYESYYENGQLKEKGIYENSERIGEWEKFDIKGNKI